MQKGKQFVPQLRFSEFVGVWKEKKYNQIYSFYSTNSFSRDNLNYQNGEVKNIHYGDIHTKFQTIFDITKEKVPFINSEVSLSKIKEENYCKEGDLLIADASEDYNDIGKTIEIINLNNEKLISGLHTFLARPNKHQMAIGFTGYLLQSWRVRKQIMTIAQGTKVLGLATSRLGKVNLTIPDYEEQQKIANFLTAVDNQIQTLEKKKSLLEQYKKGIMQKIFNQELRFKDEDGNAFPEWEEKKLGYYFVERKEKGLENYPLYSLTIEDGVVPKSKRYEREFLVDNTKHAYKVMYKNDFAFNPMNLRFGALKRFKGDILINVSKYYNIFYCNDQGSANFFDYYLTSYNMIQYYNKMATGTLEEKKRVHYLEFIKFKKLIPSLKEQIKIANFLSAIDKNIALVNIKIEHTKAYKKGLLQQMFV